MKIKAYVKFDEVNKVHSYRFFEVEKALPEVGDIVRGSDYDGEKVIVASVREAGIDTCQGCDDVYNYDYFVVEMKLLQMDENDEWQEVEAYDEFIAIEKVFEDDDN
jgi:hypothetical protein